MSENIGTQAIAVIILVAMIAVASVPYGIAITVLWQWFITPTFGLHEITLAQAMGLWLLINLFLKNPDFTKTPVKSKIEWRLILLNGLAAPSLVLMTGYVIHQLT